MPPLVAATLDLDDPEEVDRRKRALGSSTFEYRGRTLAYHVAGGNTPFDNERAVELAIAADVLSTHEHPNTVIEVGNVLAHYFSTRHAVLDKFEHHRAVTWNEDVLDFGPPFAPELIVSVSSLEHVGHVETPRDPTGFPRAVDHLLSWLRPGGELVITVPLGYNPSVLALLEDRAQPFEDIDVMRRVSAENEWTSATLEEVRGVSYGRPFPCANALVIARARKSGATARARLPPAEGLQTRSAARATSSAELKDLYDHSYYGRMAGGQVHERKGHLRELPNAWRAASLILAPQVRAATDVGAGRGELALHLIEGGTRVTLLDYAEPAMEIAREHVGESEFASFVVGDASRLTEYVEPASQDAVFMTDVVEHISSPELRMIFGQVREILAPGGTLVVHTPEKYAGPARSATTRISQGCRFSCATPSERSWRGRAFAVGVPGITCRSIFRLGDVESGEAREQLGWCGAGRRARFLYRGRSPRSARDRYPRTARLTRPAPSSQRRVSTGKRAGDPKQATKPTCTLAADDGDCGG